MNEPIRDYIVVEDELGNEKKLAIEALFNMKDQSYALLSTDSETLLMRVQEEADEQTLIGINDPEERESILDAYQIAVEAAQDDSDHV